MCNELTTNHPVLADERSQLTEVLRQLSANELSYRALLQVYDRFLQSEDDAVRSIYLLLLESLYDDINPDGLITLSDEMFSIISTCIHFLSTTHCYSWPVCPVISYYDILLLHSTLFFLEILVVVIYWQPKVMFIIVAIHAILALLIHSVLRKMKQRRVDKWKKFGDFSVWPFVTQEDYQGALEMRKDRNP